VQQTEWPIAWLSLDENDSDTIRFLAYLVAALNQVEGIEATLGRGALGMLQSPQPPPATAVLTSLINDVIARLQELIAPTIVQTLADAFPPAQLGDALLASQPFQNNANLLLP